MYKKITISCVLSLLALHATAAEPPVVKLGGRMDTMIGYTNQRDAYSAVIDNNNKFTNMGTEDSKYLVNDTKININIDGETDAGMQYGGLIQLNADTSRSTTGEDSNASKTMAYIRHDKIGMLQGGNYYGAAAMLEMDTTSALAKAAYGIEGFWAKWTNEDAYINLSSISPLMGYTRVSDLSGHKYIVTPNIPSNYSGNHYAAAPKVTFYTQPHSSVTLGVSFIPDLDSSGTIAGVAPSDNGPVDAERADRRPTFRNIISGGIQFKQDLNDAWNIKATIAGEIGQAKKYMGTKYIRGLKAYEVGAAIGYKDLVVAATYGDWLKTATYKNPFPGTKQGTSYWTLGAAYTYGDIGASLTFMKSKKAGGLEAVGNNIQYNYRTYGATISPNSTFSDTAYNKFTNVSLGLEYKLAPGFMPYMEVTRFLFKDYSAYKGNQGTIYLSGVRLTF